MLDSLAGNFLLRARNGNLKAEWITVPRHGAPQLVLLDEHNKLIAEYEISPQTLAILVSRGAEWLANHYPKDSA